MLVILALGVLVADGPALDTIGAATFEGATGATAGAVEVRGAKTAVGMVEVPVNGMPPTNAVVGANGAEETAAPGIEGAIDAIGGIMLDDSGCWVGFIIPAGCDIIGGTVPIGWAGIGGIIFDNGGPPIKFCTVGAVVGIGGIIPVGAVFTKLWDIKFAPPILDKSGWFGITGGCWTGGTFVISIGALTNAGFGRGGIAGGDSAFKEAKSWGGRTFGTSNPRSFRLISLQAIENSFMSIFPSASVSARALKKENTVKDLITTY